MFMEQPDHLFIRNLWKACVMRAEREEMRGLAQAKELICIRGKFGGRIGGGNRDCHENPGRGSPPERPYRCFDSGTGGGAIIDQDYGFLLDCSRFPVGAVCAATALDFRIFSHRNSLDIRTVQMECCKDLVIEDDVRRIAVCDCRRCEFRISGRRHLAHNEHIQRGSKRVRHLRSDWNTSSRQSDYDRIREPQFQKPGGEQTPGLGTIAEHDRDPN